MLVIQRALIGYLFCVRDYTLHVLLYLILITDPPYYLYFAGEETTKYTHAHIQWREENHCRNAGRTHNPC